MPGHHLLIVTFALLPFLAGGAVAEDESDAHVHLPGGSLCYVKAVGVLYPEVWAESNGLDGLQRDGFNAAGRPDWLLSAFEVVTVCTPSV